MALATDSSPGEIQLAGDLAGSTDATSPELTLTSVTPGLYTFSDLTIDSKGRVTAATTADSGTILALIPDATTSTKGIVQIGDGISVSVDGLITADMAYINANAIIPTASLTTKGLVQIGDGISVDTGLITADLAYIDTNMSDATLTSKGQVQIGNGISVATGVISADIAYIDANMSHPVATNTTFGIVKPVDVNDITIVAGEIGFGPDVALLNTANTWIKSQVVNLVDLGSVSSNVAIDSSLGNVLKMTMIDDIMLDNPSNLVGGQTLVLTITQSGQGHAVIFGTMYKFKNGNLPTIPQTPNKIMVLSAIFDGTKLLCNFGGEF